MFQEPLEPRNAKRVKISEKNDQPPKNPEKEKKKARKEVFDKIWKELVKNKAISWPFLAPVDHVALNLPDYPTVFFNFFFFFPFLICKLS